MLPRERHLAKRGLIKPRANFDTFSSSFYSVFQVQQQQQLVPVLVSLSRSVRSCKVLKCLLCSAIPSPML